MWTEPWYIPCAGVKPTFNSFCLVKREGRPYLWIQRAKAGAKRKVHQKHLIDTDDLDSFRKIRRPDFEIAVGRDGSGGPVDLTDAHVFTFLLMIKTGGWLHAPAVLSTSIFDERGDDVFCCQFTSGLPFELSNTKLSLADVKWIQSHLSTAREFTNEPRFQNAMQSLTSFHCVPFANLALLISWAGIEALFKTEQELSFRLCLYVSNYIRRGSMREVEFKRLRSSYAARSKVAHGSSTATKDISEHAHYTRDILRECLRRSLELKVLPKPDALTFR